MFSIIKREFECKFNNLYRIEYYDCQNVYSIRKLKV